MHDLAVAPYPIIFKFLFLSFKKIFKSLFLESLTRKLNFLKVESLSSPKFNSLRTSFLKPFRTL